MERKTNVTQFVSKNRMNKTGEVATLVKMISDGKIPIPTLQKL